MNFIVMFMHIDLHIDLHIDSHIDCFIDFYILIIDAKESIYYVDSANHQNQDIDCNQYGMLRGAVGSFNLGVL